MRAGAASSGSALMKRLCAPRLALALRHSSFLWQTSSAASHGDDLMLDADFFGGEDAHKTTTTAAPAASQAKSESATQTIAVASNTPDKPKQLIPPQLRCDPHQGPRPEIVRRD